MEQVKWISLFLIVVTTLSGVFLSFIDKQQNTVVKEKSVRRIRREETIENSIEETEEY